MEGFSGGDYIYPQYCRWVWYGLRKRPWLRGQTRYSATTRHRRNANPPIVPRSPCNPCPPRFRQLNPENPLILRILIQTLLILLIRVMRQVASSHLGTRKGRHSNPLNPLKETSVEKITIIANKSWIHQPNPNRRRPKRGFGTSAR